MEKNSENNSTQPRWHALSADDVANTLEVDASRGLTDAEALKRIEQYGPNSLPETSLLQSETFTVLAVCQWFNVLNCRSEERSAFNLGIFKNYWLVGGLTVSVVLQFAVIYWPPLNRLFHTTPIAITEFFAIGAAASLVLWVEEVRKLIVRRRGIPRPMGAYAHSSL